MSSKTSVGRALFPVSRAATGPFNKTIEDPKHSDINRKQTTFLNRRPLSLESRSSSGSVDVVESQMTIVGLRTSMARADRGSVSSTDSLLTGDLSLPPLRSSQSSRNSANYVEPEVLNLPMLHQSKHRTPHETRTKHLGTIRRAYEIDDSSLPVVIHSLPGAERDFLSEDEENINAVFGYNQRTSTEYDLDGGRESNISEDSCAIAPFPPVEKTEQDKHKLLNEEAEKNNKKTKADRFPNGDYLKRLKLVRKPLPPVRHREKRSKSIFKRMQTKQKLQSNKDDIFLEKEEPAPLPNPVEKSSKSTKLIIGFRYSFAVEEYYRGKLTNLASFAPIAESVVSHRESEDEVINGWVIKSVGAKALNLSARSLPSCNPIELRMRVQQARMRKLLERKAPSSRGSMTSRSYVKSNLGFTKLQNIEEGLEAKQQSPMACHVGKSEHVHGDTVVASPERDSESVDVFHKSRRSPSKTLSLSLPAVTFEE